MAAFIALLWLASFSGWQDRWVSLFLIADPLVSLVHTLAGRVLVPALVVSLVMVAIAVAMGTVFCSHACPMGTFFDVSDRLFRRVPRARPNREKYAPARKVKFAVLVVILSAALFGFNLLGLADPIVMFTRFCAVLFYPALMVLGDLGLFAARPVAEWLGWLDLQYTQLILPAFEGAVALGVILVSLVVLGKMQQRFWCRHLCPLGALLGLLGAKAPYRRRVSDKCTGCNTCTRLCPTGAIHDKGREYDRSECIDCLDCTRNCPEGAVSFGFGKAAVEQARSGHLPGRRLLLRSAAGGALGAALLRADMLHPSGAFLPLPLRNGRLIRPPGALPEPEFLARCTRCGECMRACLTNTIQPDWYRAGFEGLWAPHLAMRHAACEQTCNVCGLVCPTGAIRPLSLKEKQHAKIGTAVIKRDRCLPWSQDHRCLICDEQCPYNAIVFRHDERHTVGLPVVNPKRCNGCGQCEDKCPVIGESAIVVVPQGELRLSTGSYVEEAKALGLVFEAKKGKFQDEFLLEGERKRPGRPAGQNGSGFSGEPSDLPAGIDEGVEQRKPSGLPPGIDDGGQ
ncbi:MAG: 4Fe-4S dicluster domain-containing protein [Deltaproteobacteria bacterium]|nr:MAG: 4Fe-4S dicluster domain-containing protein [Deltaproteobacteria bacterium]